MSEFCVERTHWLEEEDSNNLLFKKCGELEFDWSKVGKENRKTVLVFVDVAGASSPLYSSIINQLGFTLLSSLKVSKDIVANMYGGENYSFVIVRLNKIVFEDFPLKLASLLNKEFESCIFFDSIRISQYTSLSNDPKLLRYISSSAWCHPIGKDTVRLDVGCPLYGVSAALINECQIHDMPCIGFIVPKSETRFSCIDARIFNVCISMLSDYLGVLISCPKENDYLHLLKYDPFIQSTELLYS